MRFDDVAVDQEGRYALGVEACSGRCYLSIPVSNRLVDYEEYYAIDAADLARFRADPAAARAFAQRCRRRELDHLLIVAPGRDRGTAGCSATRVTRGWVLAARHA